MPAPFKKCCFCVQLRAGVLAIATMIALVAVAFFVYICFIVADKKDEEGGIEWRKVTCVMVDSMFLVLILICMIFLALGVFKKHSSWMLYGISLVVCMNVFAMAFSIYYATHGEYESLAVWSILLPFLIYFYYVVWSYTKTLEPVNPTRT